MTIDYIYTKAQNFEADLSLNKIPNRADIDSFLDFILDTIGRIRSTETLDEIFIIFRQWRSIRNNIYKDVLYSGIINVDKLDFAPDRFISAQHVETLQPINLKLATGSSELLDSVEFIKGLEPYKQSNNELMQYLGHIDSSFTLRVTMVNHADKARNLFAQGQLFKSREEYRRVVKQYNDLLNDGKAKLANIDWYLIAYAWHGLGNIEYVQGKATAFEYYRNSLKIKMDLRDYFESANVDIDVIPCIVSSINSTRLKYIVSNRIANSDVNTAEHLEEFGRYINTEIVKNVVEKNNHDWFANMSSDYYSALGQCAFYLKNLDAAKQHFDTSLRYSGKINSGRSYAIDVRNYMWLSAITRDTTYLDKVNNLLNNLPENSPWRLNPYMRMNISRRTLEEFKINSGELYFNTVLSIFRDNQIAQNMDDI